MGFKDDILKGFKTVIKGIPPKHIARADIPGREKWGEKLVKPNPPEKPKNIFGGEAFITEEKRMEWLRKHKNEIYRMTKGRITEGELAKLDEELFQKYKKQGGIVTEREVMRDQSGVIPDLEKKRFYKAKTDTERYNIKEDAAIARKMLGLEQKK